MLDRLRKLNLERVPYFGHTLNSWSPLEWAGAMAGEVGEACNIAKKMRRLKDGCSVNTPEQTVLVDNLAEELADIIIYADILAASLNISLEDAIRSKFNKVSARVEFKELL